MLGKKPPQREIHENKAKKNMLNPLDTVSDYLYSLTAMAKVITELTCKRCGHKWYPRKPEKPRHCANKTCNSPYWDRPRRKEKAA